MAWTIKFDANVEKKLKKLGVPAAKQIFLYLKNIANADNPRQYGKALKGSLREGDIEQAIIELFAKFLTMKSLCMWLMLGTEKAYTKNSIK